MPSLDPTLAKQGVPLATTGTHIQRPLDGVRVLELARFHAGPRCGVILSDLGAEVIKIESPGGESTRRSPPLVDGQSLYFTSNNRGKKSICLDMRTDAGKSVFRDLVPVSDMVLENFRPGTMDKMGFGYEELTKLRKDIILLSISGFGQTGPQRDRTAFDAIGQAMSGLMTLTGKKGGPPVSTGFALVDRMAALMTTIGALAALRHRDATGEGQVLDVALLDTALSMVEVPTGYYLSTGAESDTLLGTDPYTTSDGWVVLNAVTRLQRDGLGQAIGVEPNGPDGNAPLWANESLKQMLTAWCAEHTTAEVCAALEAVDVPVAACRTIPEVASDPYILERAVLVETMSGGFPVYGPGPAVKLSKTPARAGRTASPGEHADEVLRDVLGYDDSRRSELADAGAFGSAVAA
jgi:crotonobetainyl-CoA:carnitine CoA-transferase CaiB-like acyl-CoA transferase